MTQCNNKEELADALWNDEITDDEARENYPEWFNELMGEVCID